MARYRSGYLRVDVSELLDEIEDDALLEEIKHRKLIVPGNDSDFVPEDDIRDARMELLRNRPAEALAILDRIWTDMKAAQSALHTALTQGEQKGADR